jgi:hypothetical protein
MPDELRDRLFPNGMPSLEEFIAKIAEYLKETEAE